VTTTDDFDGFQWHDNAIHGIRVEEGDDGCLGQLILNIDFIVEWLASTDNTFSFRIAPADLAFHGVSDLIISVNYAAATAAVQPMMIHQIHRESMTHPNGYSEYSWKVEINWPSGFISFKANGYTQTLRQEPVTSGAQYLSPAERNT
jgi:hypothetical protein